MRTLDEACAEQWHDRKCNEVGGEQRNNNREGQRGEQKTAYTVK